MELVRLILRAVGVDTIGRDNESISKEMKKTIETKTQVTVLNSAILTAKSCYCPPRKGIKQNYSSLII